jgi:hypothetical protein
MVAALSCRYAAAAGLRRPCARYSRCQRRRTRLLDVVFLRVAMQPRLQRELVLADSDRSCNQQAAGQAVLDTDNMSNMMVRHSVFLFVISKFCSQSRTSQVVSLLQAYNVICIQHTYPVRCIDHTNICQKCSSEGSSTSGSIYQ